MDFAARVQAASRLLERGQARAALPLLEALAAEAPDSAPVICLLAGARLHAGDSTGALELLDAAARRRPEEPSLQAALGDVLLRRGAVQDAERALAAALRLDPQQTAPLLHLQRLYRSLGRWEAALDAGRRLLRLMPTRADAHAELARSFAAAGRHDEAVAAQRRAVTLAPPPAQSAQRLNLVLALLDAGQVAEARDMADALQRAGLDAPELWFAQARAALAQERWDEAERGFGEALRRRPDYLAAHTDLAQLRWTRHGDLAHAAAELDAALRQLPGQIDLHVARIGLSVRAGDHADAAARRAAALARWPDDPRLLLVAADAALNEEPAAALHFAERAAALAGAAASPLLALADAQLANGLGVEAMQTAQRVLAGNPEDQHALADLATAQRLAGAARDAAFADYASIVRAWRLDTPPGWNDLAAYLRDLAASLRCLHTTRAHPLGQTLREGTQTNQDLTRSDDPVIRAFVQAIDGPLRRHMAALGQGDDPLRRRNRGSYRIQGMWSVQLRPHGFHVDHFHPEGWLSSACYIDLPPSLGDDADHAGWIQFGRPGMPTQPPLPAEYFVRPEPGLLVLFPSYLWHGTVPFAGAEGETRLTIAFDVVPGEGA